MNPGWPAFRAGERAVTVLPAVQVEVREWVRLG